MLDVRDADTRVMCLWYSGAEARYRGMGEVRDIAREGQDGGEGKG